MDKSKGWSKRSAEKDGDTACSNKNMGGDPLPGVPKACFCSQSGEEEAEEKAFYFDANKPDAFYNLKVKYGQGVKKLADGSFDFRNSMISYTGNNLQMRNKHNGKKENPEGMATHNWEL